MRSLVADYNGRPLILTSDSSNSHGGFKRREGIWRGVSMFKRSQKIISQTKLLFTDPGGGSHPGTSGSRPACPPNPEVGILAQKSEKLCLAPRHPPRLTFCEEEACVGRGKHISGCMASLNKTLFFYKSIFIYLFIRFLWGWLCKMEQQGPEQEVLWSSV